MHPPVLVVVFLLMNHTAKIYEQQSFDLGLEKTTPPTAGSLLGL
jgi:hypothetical protein